MPAVWWVNQKDPQYAIDLSRGYRWSPSRTEAGGVRESWRCLEDMVPGDIWLNWEQQSIAAIGVVTAPPEPFEWPSDQGDQRRWPGAGGVRVWFHNFDLDRPIRADEIPDDWKRKAGPFRANLWVKLSSVEPVDPGSADELRRMFADRWPVDSPWGKDPVPAPARAGCRFWLDIHTPETWELFRTSDFNVATLSRKVDSVRPGDVLLNYIPGAGGRWVSAEEVLAEARPVTEQRYQGYEGRWEWPIRALTARLPLVAGVVVRDTVPRLRLFEGADGNWGVRVRRSFVEIDEADAELIIGWIEQASEEAR